MDAHARASIEIDGAIMRYAEVEHYGPRYRLLRLGSCEFDFDLSQTLLRGAEAEHLDVVEEALGDVLQGLAAEQVSMVVHPPFCYSFFTPLPEGVPAADRLERLQTEARLVTASQSTRPLRLTVDAAGSLSMEQGDVVTWWHTLALPESIYTRFEHLMRRWPRARHRLMLSMQGAARVVGQVEARRDDPAVQTDAPFVLAVGWYGTHVEYVLTRGEDWLYSHFTAPGSAADCAYFAVALLERLGLEPSHIGRVYLYGSDVEPTQFHPLRLIFRVAPERLSPIQAVDLDPGSLTAGFSAEAYAPCLGAAL